MEEIFWEICTLPFPLLPKVLLQSHQTSAAGAETQVGIKHGRSQHRLPSPCRVCAQWGRLCLVPQNMGIDTLCQHTCGCPALAHETRPTLSEVPGVPSGPARPVWGWDGAGSCSPCPHPVFSPQGRCQQESLSPPVRSEASKQSPLP